MLNRTFTYVGTVVLCFLPEFAQAGIIFTEGSFTGTPVYSAPASRTTGREDGPGSWVAPDRMTFDATVFGFAVPVEGFSGLNFSTGTATRRDADLSFSDRPVNAADDDSQGLLAYFASADLVFAATVPLPAGAVLVLSALGFSGFNRDYRPLNANRSIEANYA